ncbi:MAG: pyrroline-5-carboxylate reductase [Planctomycetes bacterium]|nr:pyrroline-5-carboxylate reductase [Planctomycetota bacterium]
MRITLTVIGGGNMAKAIIQGAIVGGVLEGCEIAIADPDQTSRDFFTKLGCIATASAQELPDSDCTLLAVKPQVFETVAGSIRADVVYSIMAGVSTSQIAKEVGHNRIVRIMPNLPCSIGFGAAGIALGSSATLEDAALANKLFSAIGVVVDVQEAELDAVTAVSGSGPAYLFLLAEAMIEGGIQAGLTRETATLLTQQTVLGASELLVRDASSARQLREAVTSKGGTTAAALQVMQDRNVPKAIADAIVAARDRGRELGAG